MKPITPEAEQMVREKVPQFVVNLNEILARKHASAGSTLRLELDTFDDDPLLLYATLWFASSKRVSVLFLP